MKKRKELNAEAAEDPQRAQRRMRNGGGDEMDGGRIGEGD